MIMAKAKVIRHKKGETDKIQSFADSTPYEDLKIGDIVELVFPDRSLSAHDNVIEKCVVINTSWDFSHFDPSGIYEIHVEPVKDNA
jgi:hypothetical protein